MKPSPIPENLRRIIEDVRAEGDREERESGVEVCRGLRRARHKPARTTVLPSRPLGLYDAGLDYPEVDGSELPARGCDLPDLKVYLHDPQQRVRAAARAMADAVYVIEGACSEEVLRQGLHAQCAAHEALIEALRDTGAVYLHARVEA